MQADRCDQCPQLPDGFLRVGDLATLQRAERDDNGMRNGWLGSAPD